MGNKCKNRETFNILRKLLRTAAFIYIFMVLSATTVWAANPDNAPTKGSVVAGYLKDPDLATVSARCVYKAPEGDIKATYKSVADMRANATGHADGDYIQTLNYYEGVAGGGAVYRRCNRYDH